VTVNGKPDAVLLDVEVFEKKLKSLNLGLLLAEAEADVNKGRTREARTFLKEFKGSAKISCNERTGTHGTGKERSSS
jgi:hypothetical protein